jgi:hypothetical protein
MKKKKEEKKGRKKRKKIRSLSVSVSMHKQERISKGER